MPWDSTRPNGKVVVSTEECADSPGTTEAPVTDPPVTDPPVTDPPTPEPATWGEWSAWTTCSAACGEGTQSRSRSCSQEGQCDGDALQTQSCTGPDGACPSGSWTEWSAWNACSAGCGEGVQSRSRECSEEGQCQGEPVERQLCTGPDGDCPQGCKITLGDFAQEKEQTCDEMFRAEDGYYLPKSGRCTSLSCTSSGTAWKKWVCACTKADGCFFKVDNDPISITGFGENFNAVTDCKQNLGGASTIGNREKRYRWADGRRSAAQPESEVSGGDDYELMNICYSLRAHNYAEMVEYSRTERQSDFDQLSQDLGLPFEYEKAMPAAGKDRMINWVTTFTYGRVIERDDGRLVCQFLNPKYPDWSEEQEDYLQLSVKRGTARWITSEHWLIWPSRPQHTTINFSPSQLISQGSDIGDSRSNYYVGPNNWLEHIFVPVNRYLCRVQDSRDQKWHNGVVTEYQRQYGTTFGASGAWGSSTSNIRPVCTAIAPDGTILSSHAHNYWTDKEEDSDRLKTEYFVLSADDGSYWSNWSEWGECSNFCGTKWGDDGNLKRKMTRTCHNANGEEISYKNGQNCFPDADFRLRDADTWSNIDWTDNWGRSSVYYDEKTGDCRDEDILSEVCPKWSRWSDFTDCSVTCGTGSRSRTVSLISIEIFRIDKL